MRILSSTKNLFLSMKTIKYDYFLAASFIWVWLVSMLDHYPTIKFQKTIIESEKNPFGLWLIEIDNGSVALFMTLKMMCLWIIAAIILCLYRTKKKMAYVSIIALSLTQLALLFYFLQ